MILIELFIEATCRKQASDMYFLVIVRFRGRLRGGIGRCLALVHLPFIAASGIRRCLKLDSWNLESCSSEEIQRKSTTKKLKTEHLHRFDIRDTFK
ncbi:hypothetical protein J6590_041384 [Homalodisca vitripennis]|nr:hypothetical protein J6590_041384 [Homalodisca vitripennis]